MLKKGLLIFYFAGILVYDALAFWYAWTHLDPSQIQDFMYGQVAMSPLWPLMAGYLIYLAF